MHAYQLVLRPWTWLLSQAADSRIFQNKSVVDIIKDVFQNAGFTDYEVKLSETYKPLEYCVQYRETHLDFVLRLMEQFGIYYYFKHQSGKHTMVIADSISAHEPIADLPAVDLIAMGERTRDDKEYLRGWTAERAFQTGKVAIKAYDFAKPDADMKYEQSKGGGYAKDDLEVFVYPAQVQGRREGRPRPEIRQGDAPVRARRATSAAMPKATRRACFPGGSSKLRQHEVGSENRDYLVVAAASFRGRRSSTARAAEKRARPTAATTCCSRRTARSAPRRSRRGRWCTARRPRWWSALPARKSTPTSMAG